MSKSAKELHGEQLYKMTWANKYPWVFVLALFRLLVYICKLQVARGMVATVSSFISGAGYGLREKKGLKKFALIAIGGEERCVSLSLQSVASCPQAPEGIFLSGIFSRQPSLTF